MPSEPKKGADFLAALSECPDCGGPRRDTGGKVLEYHHTKTCARVLDVQKLFADLSPAVVRDEEPYVASENIDPALREELREWQTASAHTFLRFEDALPENASVSPPSAEELPEQDFTAGLSTPQPTCVGIDMRCGECGNRVLEVREHLTHDGRCLMTAYRRRQSALDALAVAVKGCGAHTLCGKNGPSGYLCGDCEERRDAAITALLDGRTTT